MTPRQRWIATGMVYLFGQYAQPQSGGAVPPSGPGQGLSGSIGLATIWANEGVTRGFVPATVNGLATNIVVASDFTSLYPNCNDTLFLAAFGALQILQADYAANYATIAAIKP